MNEELVSQVEELGLSNKEARVYVASLMLGPATVQRIAEFASIKRVTTYVILESLVNLGLASQISKGKKTFFSAEDPIKLRRLLDKKEQQLKEQKENFDHILPDLTSLKNLPSDSPSVKFFEGIEGVKSVLLTFFQTNQTDLKDKIVYGISNLDQVHNLFPEFREAGANPERYRAGYKSKYIYTSSQGPILKATDKQRRRESRFVPIDKYPLNGDFNIVGDQVVLYTLVGHPLAITIQSAEMAKLMLGIFEMAWDAAGEIAK